MRYLGLDVGTKTVGVAISDKTNTIASFMKVIRFDNGTKDKMFNELCQIISDYKITNVIIGLPKNMDNSLGFASQRSIDFKEELEKRIDVQFDFMDERLTTTEAENILINADIKRKSRKKVIDGVAATIILESYIRMKGNENNE